MGRLRRTTGAPVSERHRIKGGPTALKVSAGPYSGWWFPEARGVTWLRGATDLHAYRPRVKVVLAAGRTYSAYRLGSSGAVEASRTISVGSASTSAPSTANALVEGRPAFRIDAGSLAGYWLPSSPRSPRPRIDVILGDGGLLSVSARHTFLT